MCIAVLAFALLRTVISAWYAGVEASSANRLVTRNAISLVFPLPLSYRSKIQAVDGVTAVSYGNWFGGYYIDRKNFFANFAVEPRTYLELYPEFILPAERRQAFLKDRRACVVGRKLARRFGWEIGDSITLKGTIFPGDWQFVLRAIYRGRDDTIDENQFFFHWDYLNETLKKTQPRRADQVGFYVLGIVNPELAAVTTEAVDRLFKNSLAETLTETEKAFQLGFVSMSEAIITAIRLVSLVIIVIIMVVVANTMAMSVRDRLGEYAIFKTLGFSGSYLTGLIFGESLLISALGGGAGILLTFPVVKIFGKLVGNWFPVFKVESKTMYLAVLAVFVIGSVASMIPVWRAVRLRVVEALRRIG